MNNMSHYRLLSGKTQIINSLEVSSLPTWEVKTWLLKDKNRYKIQKLLEIPQTKEIKDISIQFYIQKKLMIMNAFKNRMNIRSTMNKTRLFKQKLEKK